MTTETAPFASEGSPVVGSMQSPNLSSKDLDILDTLIHQMVLKLKSIGIPPMPDRHEGGITMDDLNSTETTGPAQPDIKPAATVPKRKGAPKAAKRKPAVKAKRNGFTPRKVKGKVQRAKSYSPGYDVVCVRAPNGVCDQIRAKAKRKGISISALVSEAVSKLH